jgi:hypothetical protein
MARLTKSRGLISGGEMIPTSSPVTFARINPATAIPQRPVFYSTPLDDPAANGDQALVAFSNIAQMPTEDILFWGKREIEIKGVRPLKDTIFIIATNRLMVGTYSLGDMTRYTKGMADVSRGYDAVRAKLIKAGFYSAATNISAPHPEEYVFNPKAIDYFQPKGEAAGIVLATPRGKMLLGQDCSGEVDRHQFSTIDFHRLVKELVKQGHNPNVCPITLGMENAAKWVLKEVADARKGEDDPGLAAAQTVLKLCVAVPAKEMDPKPSVDARDSLLAYLRSESGKPKRYGK